MVLDGYLNIDLMLDGDLATDLQLDGEVGVFQEVSNYDYYTGEYVVTP